MGDSWHMCSWLQYLKSACRSAVAQALPQLQLLDRLLVDNEREFLAQRHGPTAQHIAELQLQAYQPQTEAPQSEQQPVASLMSEAADTVHEQAYPWPAPVTYLQGVPMPQDQTYLQCMQQLPSQPRAPGQPEALARDDVQNLADRLAQRLAQSRAVLPDEAAADSAKQEQRFASMEARLSALLEGRLPLPDEAHVSRQAGPRKGCSHETQPPNRFSATDARRDSTSQRQPPVRPDDGCTGAWIAPSTVQRLQVEVSCPVDLSLLTVMQCICNNVSGCPHVMSCVR